MRRPRRGRRRFGLDSRKIPRAKNCSTAWRRRSHLGDPRAARLLELCSKPPRSPTLPNQAWLLDPKLPPLVAANLRLLYGRWLVQGSLIEEALEQLSGLHPGDVAAPAELLFYQGVVYHRTLNRDEGLRVLNELLDGAESSPRRYVAVAHLMQADLEDLKPDTLDHIARRMEDIWRRLELGRGGPKVRKAEDGVVQSLDKMILKIEKQQQQQQQYSGNGGQNNKPADASRPMGGKGLGEVTKRNIGGKSGWGDLPPKEREEAMQQIGRDFPAHYRDAIEQYFRRLSTEEDSGENASEARETMSVQLITVSDEVDHDGTDAPRRPEEERRQNRNENSTC